MEEIIIRQVASNEIAELVEISKQTFLETFAAGNTEEDMKKYLQDNLSQEKLTAEFSDTNSQFYFAESRGSIIGYLKLNTGPAQTELKDNKGFEIERIYVSKEYHGKKVGQLLYEKALAIAAELRAEYVWLGVWEKNTRAINFYKKNGFVEFDKHIFVLGNDEQTDIMMQLELQKDS